MEVMCFDLEGVLVPEIWINVALETGIDELKLTTRDVPDYDELMAYRLRILDQHQLRIDDIKQVIARLKPLDGAVEFLAWVRRNFQVVILSDTFYDFAEPLIAQLDHPMLCCHNLEIAPDGRITNWLIRLPRHKMETVKALKALNFTVFAAGDSYNDTDMLIEADTGYLFTPPPNVIAEFPQLPVVNTFEALKAELIRASSRKLTA
ncbi:MAG: bifunctional phosphoserine phosphatase/homoserine phosphotransferase ThrH [Micrococcales bacterium]|nr:bifunctional phosphoserine phosphatase/homoserine phosphotransferase ThrH [Micrococcales bacterium]